MGDEDVKTAKRTLTCRRRSRMRLRHSHTNNPLPFLPEELIVKILLSLSVKSLFQFRCVCKSWKTLISDSQFANNHLLNSTAYPQLVTSVIDSDCGISEIKSYHIPSLLENSSTPVIPVGFSTRHRYSTLGSCNGLLCLYNANQCYVRLWNPSINFKSKKSPTFDGLITYHGFGYDQVNDKYKLLAVVMDDDDDSRQTVTMIHTFGENSWKNVEDFPRHSHTRTGKFVSGTLNWIVDESDGDTSNQAAILFFDLTKETYGDMLLPDGCCHGGLYVLSNCICVCFDHSNESCWDMWMMKEYGVVESWTKLMTVPREESLLLYYPPEPYVEPLFISENGVVLLVNTLSSQIILYNLNSGGLDYPRILGFRGSLLPPDLYIYHESLVSPQW